MDLLIKNGTIVTSAGRQRLDVGIRDGKIVELADLISAPGAETIDAAGKLVFPGFIDAHTHMGIPIMDTHSIDDFESGSVAAACGGITTIIDFTVHEAGQTLRQSINVRIAKARGKSHIDFGLHVNVTDQPQNRLDEIPELITEGFTAYKVFSTYREAGMMISWSEFRQLLQQVHQYGGLLFLHAEDNDLIEAQTDAHVRAGLTSAIYHARSRTAEAEAKAITSAAQIAAELNARLYIVHLSSKAGLEAALTARAQGVSLLLETCPQYLVLSEEVYNTKNGHYWITTPSLKTREDQEALWLALAAGDIDVVATDHCPFTIAQKEHGGRKFHKTPNGIPGVETLLPLLYAYGVAEGKISAERLVALLAEKPARLLGLSDRKGSIEIGRDADLVIWDPEAEYEIDSSRLHGNAGWSPYEGFRVRGRLQHTIQRGRFLVRDGDFVGHQVFGELLTSR